jgi:Mlc titration factor MtfA (ptsG expression regulator)
VRAWPQTIRWHAIGGFMLALAVGGFLALISKPAAALIGVVVGAGYYVGSTMRYRRRRTLLAAPIDPAWRDVLAKRVRFYRDLPGGGRKRFEDDVRIFIAEQTIGGLEGADVSDEVKVLIAASAAMLSHGIPNFEWPRVRDIVVYPRAFDEDYDANGEHHIAGMVHLYGPVLFSQRDLKHGFRRARDGHNVGIHELAHVMDMADGAADGIPGDLPWVSNAPWIELMADRLGKLRRRKYRHVLRDYAATNEAEFFAVAVEAFFEQPRKLRQHDPELFDMLVQYFKQDPR